MTDLEWFRLLFAVAFGMWICVDVVFTSRYIKSLFEVRFRSPFILGTVVVAVTGTLEVSLYGYAVWFQPNQFTFLRWVIFSIPIAAMLQALAFMMIANWVFTDKPSKLTVPSPPSTL